MGLENTTFDLTTLNYIVLGIFGVAGLLGAISGLSKGFIRTALKVASIMVAVFVAFSIMPTVMAKAYEVFLPQLDDLLAPAGEFVMASPTLKEYLPTLLMSIATPIVFIVVFLACLFVVGIVRGLINLIIKAIFTQKPGLLGRLGGMMFGLVAGVLVALCFLFPIAGYLTAVPDIYANVREVVVSDEQPIDPEVEEIIVNLPNIQGVAITNNITFKYFKQLASYTDGETQVYALDDIKLITAMLNPALSFMGSVGDIETLDTQSLRDINEIIGQHKTLRTIFAEILSTASTKWTNNQEFMGFNLKQQIDPDYAFALDVVLADLAVTTEETVCQDIFAFAKNIDTFKQFYAYSKLLSSENVTMDQLDEQLTTILQGLDGITADLAKELISEDFLADMGVQNPDVVADLVAEVIVKSSDNISDSSIPKDAAAINSIMHLAAGDTSVTAEEVVADIAASNTIKNAIADVVNTETPPVIQVTTETKTQIVDAMQNIDDPELVENLKKLFDIM